VNNFMQLGGPADSLHPFIWSRMSGLMQFCDGPKRRTSNVVQISEKVTESLSVITQVSGKESMNCTRVFK
jgi:hypothetical protein